MAHLKRNNPSVCKRTEFEPVVQNGLAMTPSEMHELMQQGQAISAQNMQSIKEETPRQRNDFFVGLEHTRGFDMVDGWNAQRDVQAKVRTMKQQIDAGTIEKVASQD